MIRSVLLIVLLYTDGNIQTATKLSSYVCPLAIRQEQMYIRKRLPALGKEEVKEVLLTCQSIETPENTRELRDEQL